MGTSLSISPAPQEDVDEPKRRTLSKPRLLVTAFGFKLIKRKSDKKVNPCRPPFPTRHDGEENCPTQPGGIKMPSQNLDRTKHAVTEQLENVQKNQPVHIIVQASTGELLLCLGRFLRRRCLKVSDLTSNEVIAWLRNVDRTLLMQGWQEEGFITPPILVFVYLLCRDTISENISCPDELRGIFLTCLYLTYSYLGSEISYPLQPFVIDTNKEVFWQQALDVIDRLSAEMLRINMDPQFFNEVFQELINKGGVKNGNSVDN